MKSLLKKYTYPFFETIRIENGQACLVDFHQRRVDRVFRYYYPGRIPLNLQEIISSLSCQTNERVKLRIEYNSKGFSTQIALYQLQDIHRLVCIETNISYPFKFSHREALNRNKASLKKFEEVLFVKNGRILESSYANVLFRFDDNWFTPLYPLFHGVMRSFLLSSGSIKTADLFIEDLAGCQEIRLINAMMPLIASISLPPAALDLSSL